MGVGVIWDAADPEPGPLTAVAETVKQPEAVHVHYHLHLPPGATAEGLSLALPQQREAIATVITEGEQE